MKQRDIIGVAAIYLSILTGFVPLLYGGQTNPCYGTDGDSPSPRNRRRVLTLSEFTYKKLQRAHDLSSRGKLPEALGILTAIADSRKANDYEKAMALHTRAYVYLATETWDKACADLESSILAQVLPPSLEQHIRFDLAQLLIHENHFEKGISVLNTWMELEEDIQPQAYMLLASAYMSTENPRNAIEAIEAAISMSEGKNPSWYRTLASLYYSLEDYKHAISTIEKLLECTPMDETLWEQLCGLYMAWGKDENALAVTETAYVNNVLTSERTLLRLSRFYLYQNLPQRAAKLLEKELKSGRIEKTGTNYQLLSEALFQARDDEAAISALKTAAEVSNAPELFVQLEKLNNLHNP